jgi:hypothetical protein
MDKEWEVEFTIILQEILLRSEKSSKRLEERQTHCYEISKE